MTAPTLNTQLAELKTSATEQSKDYKSSKKLLYSTLIDSYLWWRQANLQNGYLDNLYKTAGITAKKTGNQVNFSPLIKLIWEINAKNDATVAQWNNAMRIIHKEYNANKPVYANDASNLLVNFIRDQGGLTKMRAAAGLSDADDEFGGSQSKAKSKDAKIRGREIEKGINHFKTSKSKAVVANIGPILATKDGLVAAVGRITMGEFELLATSDDDDLVRNLAAECAEADTSSAPHNLRLLTEVIATQALPAKLARFGKRLAEDSDIAETDAEGNKTGKKKKALPRLLIRPGESDMLLSNARANVSVVTRARPMKPIVGTGVDISLNGNDRSLIEAAYIHQRELRFMEAEPQDTVKAAPADKKAAFCIETTHSVTDKKRNLYFYDDPDGKYDYQADYDDSAGFKADWKYNLNLDWLKHLHVDFIGWWINHHGNHICRSKNKSFTIKLEKGAWTVSWGAKKERDTYNTMIALVGGCTADGLTDGLEINVLSKDFLCVFNALFAAPVSSQSIVVEGDAHLMKLTYATKLAEYEVFIPLCDGKRQRDQTSFKSVGGRA